MANARSDDPTRSTLELKAPLFLTLHGVPRHEPPTAGEPAYILDPQGTWRPVQGHLVYEIEAGCVRLHDAFASALFGGIAAFHALPMVILPFIWEDGLNSELILSRGVFEPALDALRELPYLHQLLYLYDCRKLVSAVQECTKEVCFLVGEFYRSLNLDELFYPPVAGSDGVGWRTSPVVTRLAATLNVIYARLHSLLD
jgi:hypothetical protein